MEEAAVSQSIRNWKLLSDLKETASSVHIQGEEAGRDFSIFSRQNLYSKGLGLPAYERLINRISFKSTIKPLRLHSRFVSLVRLGYTQKIKTFSDSRDRAKFFRLVSLLLLSLLSVILIILV